MKLLSLIVVAGLTVVSLLVTGCTSKQQEAEQPAQLTEQKLAEMQKQLDEAKKQLAESKSAQPADMATPVSPVKPMVPLQPPAPPPRQFKMDAGYQLTVRTTNALSTKTNKAGETFTTTLTAPIAAGDWVIADKNATLEGRIVEADPGGRVKGKASISVELVSLTLADGRKVAISTRAAGAEAESSIKKDALKVGIASGIGAAVGAIAGGGKGAGIGAGVGAGAGTGAVLMTRGDAAVLPAESVLTFQLAKPLTITEKR